MRRFVAAILLLLLGQVAFAQEEHPFSATLPTGGSVTLFGIIDYSTGYYNHVSNGANTGSGGSTFQLQSGYNSVDNIGIKGTQPLDGFFGHHAAFVFDLQPGFDLVKFKVLNNKVFLTRNGFGGFTSDFGSLTAGRQWNFNDDFIIGTYMQGAYRGSVFRLTEFGELSDLHDNTIKYVSPFLFGKDDISGVQGGLYYQFKGDVGGTPAGYRIFGAMLRYKMGPFSATATYDRETDPVGNVLSSMPVIAANYVIGDFRLRSGFAFNSLRPGIAAYPGGATGISVPVPTQVNLYTAGIDWSITPKLTLSGEFDYRDNRTQNNDTQIYRASGVYVVNAYLDIYAQLVYETNANGAAESLYSNGAASYLGSGYANQTQLGFIQGVRIRF